MSFVPILPELRSAWVLPLLLGLTLGYFSLRCDLVAGWIFGCIFMPAAAGVFGAGWAPPEFATDADENIGTWILSAIAMSVVAFWVSQSLRNRTLSIQTQPLIDQISTRSLTVVWIFGCLLCLLSFSSTFQSIITLGGLVFTASLAFWTTSRLRRLPRPIPVSSARLSIAHAAACLAAALSWCIFALWPGGPALFILRFICVVVLATGAITIAVAAKGRTQWSTLLGFCGLIGLGLFSSANVSIRIDDQAGAVVPNATVSFDGSAFSSKSDERGVSIFPFMAVGPYDVLVTAPGFKPALEKSVAFPLLPSSQTIKLVVGAGSVTSDIDTDSVHEVLSLAPFFLVTLIYLFTVLHEAVRVRHIAR